MATTNLTLTHAWQLAASASATSVLITHGYSGSRIEIATTASDATAPTVSAGHVLEAGMGATRELLPSGAIWARLAPNSPASGGVLVIDAS